MRLSKHRTSEIPWADGVPWQHSGLSQKRSWCCQTMYMPCRKKVSKTLFWVKVTKRLKVLFGFFLSDLTCDQVLPFPKLIRSGALFVRSPLEGCQDGFQMDSEVCGYTHLCLCLCLKHTKYIKSAFSLTPGPDSREPWRWFLRYIRRPHFWGFLPYILYGDPQLKYKSLTRRFNSRMRQCDSVHGCMHTHSSHK